MKYNALVIGDLIAKIPLIQGGMGVGISLSGLAGAVAKEGGIGIISTAQIGYREPDYEQKPLEANLRAVRGEIKKAKEIAQGGIVGVNIMVATRFYEQYVVAACEAGVDLIISGAGLPVELPKLTEQYNVKIAPIVSSVKSASVILKMWEHKYNRVPDLVVIEGPKAGGHLGFKPDEVETITDDEYKKEILGIMEVTASYGEKHGCKIPVVVAGGISDAEKVAEIMALGADGVQVASRFVTTFECDASMEFKNAYLNAGKEDIMIVKSPVGMPGRAIRNEFIEATKQGAKSILKCYQCIKGCQAKDIPYCITKALVNSVRGNVDDGLIFCGADVWKQNKMQTVKEVIGELFA